MTFFRRLILWDKWKIGEGYIDIQRRHWMPFLRSQKRIVSVAALMYIRIFGKFVSSIRSSSVYHSLLRTYIPTHFFKYFFDIVNHYGGDNLTIFANMSPSSCICLLNVFICVNTCQKFVTFPHFECEWGHTHTFLGLLTINFLFRCWFTFFCCLYAGVVCIDGDRCVCFCFTVRGLS